MNALLLQNSQRIFDIMQIPLMQENQPYSQLPHPSGNGDRFLMGGTVAERASVPVVKAASIHHEQTPPVRTERQILPPISPDKPEERQKTTPTITLAAPRPARPVQNDTAPVIPEVKRAAPVVKESNFTIRRTTARKEWTKTVKTAAKQKKGEKP